ncbi:iron ABC transporter permease [Streptomyces sp. ST2-7A]|uniref:FecCD family ABC transporter permease n=1 Tax=Streptomyces sp. ST2-7A TaxID=2907214 RepID=UPI001F1B09B2|nr:iron ABC transporter permease [Streptomyces sp. ST2-7A]MCE7083084.1 iron ABC transporter permease [Streptomyces sp. ST2-7A]
MLGASGAALCLGTPVIPPLDLIGLLAGDGDDPRVTVVVVQLRLPRVVLALLAGACLGAAGLVLQEALRNPLAVPEMLGVSAGAALGVAVPLVLSLSLPALLVPSLALVGAALGGALTLVAAGFGRSPSAVLLTGAAITAALQAALLVVMVMADQLSLQIIYRYLLGSLSARTWEHVGGVWPWLALAVPALVLCAPVLSVLRLGDDDASALGVRVGRARLLALGVVVVLIAPVVAVCGPVAWVGFLAPQIARRLDPTGHAVRWLPWSIAWGAAIVVVADLPARLALAPVETPVGAWTALVGVPVGLLLLRSGHRSAGGGKRSGAGAGDRPTSVPQGSGTGGPAGEGNGHGGAVPAVRLPVVPPDPVPRLPSGSVRDTGAGEGR